MTTKPDEREKNQQRSERGGAHVDDVSKGIETEEPDSPFGGSGEGPDSQEDARDE